MEFSDLKYKAYDIYQNFRCIYTGPYIERSVRRDDKFETVKLSLTENEIYIRQLVTIGLKIDHLSECFQKFLKEANKDFQKDIRLSELKEHKESVND